MKQANCEQSLVGSLVVEIFVELVGFNAIQQSHLHLRDLQAVLPDSVDDFLHVLHPVGFYYRQSPEQYQYQAFRSNINRCLTLWLFVLSFSVFTAQH